MDNPTNLSNTIVSNNKSSFSLGHRRSLDGLRGIAVLLVIFHHTRLPGSIGGFLGVDLFFVLSGFLITTILLEEWERDGKISLKRFYLRRALRLLPALFLLLIGLCIFATLFLPPEQRQANYKAALITLFYLSNWVEAFALFPLGLFYHTWSLSIEEQFYLFCPLLLILLLRLRLSRPLILGIICFGIILIAVHRLILWQNGVPTVRLYNGLDTRADALLIGCSIGVIAISNWLPKARWLIITLKLLLVGLLPIVGWMVLTASSSSPYLYNGGLTLFAVTAALGIIILLTNPSGLAAKILENPLLIWFGKLSYSLYLWNFPVCYILSFPGWSQWILVPIQLIATCVAASFSFYLIEKPFLRLKEKFTTGSKN